MFLNDYPRSTAKRLPTESSTDLMYLQIPLMTFRRWRATTRIRPEKPASRKLPYRFRERRFSFPVRSSEVDCPTSIGTRTRAATCSTMEGRGWAAPPPVTAPGDPDTRFPPVLGGPLADRDYPLRRRVVPALGRRLEKAVSCRAEVRLREISNLDKRRRDRGPTAGVELSRNAREEPGASSRGYF